jgi:SAM-dependent methyltransferase
VFFWSPRVPVLCNELFRTREAALEVPRSQIALACCPACGLIHNAAFDPALVRYGRSYENGLHFSPYFRGYAEVLAGALIERYRLRGKTIVEIGCGDGQFLGLLCRLGGNRGLGFDPAYEPARAAPLPAAATIRPRAFQDTDADSKPDLICCRHVLEHVPDPLPFLAAVRRLAEASPEAVVFFEVPNALYTLERLGIWDIIYEHCLYFTPLSLARLFWAAGFTPMAVRETYEGQFLTIEARPAAATREGRGGVRRDNTPGDDSRLRLLTSTFVRRYEEKLVQWRDLLARLGNEGGRSVLWGAGSKGVTFLNVLDVPEGAIPCVVDINPRKQGCHVAGTGQIIVPPARLVQVRPNQVIVMNALYQVEIDAELRHHGVGATVLTAS